MRDELLRASDKNFLARIYHSFVLTQVSLKLVFFDVKYSMQVKNLVMSG